MGSRNFHGLVIDPEFSSLIAPLSDSEYQYLENSILEEGCREPITVWGNTIIDGHNRFRICDHWGIHFRTHSVEFSSREEAIAWICATQLGRRNITEETRKYLIGKQFDAEKVMRRKKQYASGAFQTEATDKKQPSTLMMEPPTLPKGRKNPTAERIADDYHLSHSTIEKYATYSRALDSIGKKSPPMLPKILSGKYKISHDNVLLLARMDRDSIQTLEDRLEAKEDSTAFVPFSISREEISGCLQTDDVPSLQPQIKTMPLYDPDAEVNGLALTIPTWISFISKTQDKMDLGIVSHEARQKLEAVLNDLASSIDSILRLMKEW